MKALFCLALGDHEQVTHSFLFYKLRLKKHSLGLLKTQIKALRKMLDRSWQYSSVVQCLPGMCQAKGSIPTTMEGGREGRKKGNLGA
jgi:hypothetical protein